MKSTVTLAGAAFVIALAAVPASAQNTPDTATRVKELEARVETLKASAPEAAAQDQADLEKRVKELEAKIAELLKANDTPKATLMNNEEIERATDPVGLTGFFDNGYLVGTSSDGRFKYWLDGRLNLDYAAYSGEENRLPNGAEIRRARIGVKATLFGNWLTEVDVDFADNLIEMKDMWVGYSFGNGLVKAGNFKMPFGLETLTSSKFITFIERPYIDAWAPDRRLGVGASLWGKMWQASAAVFGPEGGAFSDKDSLTGGGAGTSMRWSFGGRASVAPIHKPGRVLHIGAAATRRTPDVGKIATSGADLPDRVNASWILKLDSRAETHPSRAKFLSTGDMKYVDTFNQYGFELAGVYGPVSVQGEYQGTKVNRFATSVASYSDHSFSGYYGQAMVFVTGESRPYSASEGEFGRVIPKRPGGALELGVRYSTLNLDDLTSVDPIKGGDAKNLTFGATWYINTNHKILLNVTKVDNGANAKPGKDWAPIPAGTSTAQTVIYGDDFNTFAIRYQIAF